MEEGHQLADVGMGADEALLHVDGMAGRVADPLEPGQSVERPDQAVEPLGPALVVLAGPGVDVLAEQDELARAAVDQRFRLVEYRRPGPRDLGAARIGNDAISAELVAAFLDGQESAGALMPPRRKRSELGADRHVGVERALPACRPRHQLGKAVIGLGAYDDSDAPRPARD